MTLQERIREDLKKALKEKEELKCSVLRLLLAELKNKEIELRHKLKEEEILQVVQKETKRRNEAIEEYKKGRRDDLVEKEKKELTILKNYLPKEIPDSEIKKLIIEAIQKTNAESPSDLGRVMGTVMPQIKGRVDGSKVSNLVKEMLGGG